MKKYLRFHTRHSGSLKTYIYRIIQLFHWTSLTREASVFTILYCANIDINHQSLKNVPLS